MTLSPIWHKITPPKTPYNRANSTILPYKRVFHIIFFLTSGILKKYTTKEIWASAKKDIWSMKS